MRSITVLIRMSDNHHQDEAKSHSAGVVGLRVICIVQLLWLCRWAQHQLLSVPICCSLKVFFLYSSQRTEAVI